MATQNVIDYSRFSKATTITHHHYTNLREPTADYGDDLSTKIAALLKKPLWPQFRDGSYLNSAQATQFYRATQGISGLIHILNPTSHAEGAHGGLLNEPQQGKLWEALIALSGEMMRLADDLLMTAMDEAHR